MASNAQDPVLVTERFLLRPLTPSDASEVYLSWLADQDARRYILAAGTTRSLDDLRAYIASRVGKTDVLFLGIFQRLTGKHIGNIKYEPIDYADGSAEMGILIGDPSCRGRGVAQEVIQATSIWLKNHRRISTIHLGVEINNEGALKAYLRTGFKYSGVIRDPRTPNEIMRMTMTIDD